MGWYKKGDELVDNMFPKIIEKELFYKVQNRIKWDNKGKRSEKTVYLLRNKIKCGYCGENINGDTGTSYNGEKKHYYTCVGKRTHSKDCIKTAEQQKKLEITLDTVLKEIAVIAFSPLGKIKTSDKLKALITLTDFLNNPYKELSNIYDDKVIIIDNIKDTNIETKSNDFNVDI